MLYAKANLCFRGAMILAGAHLPADVTADELERWRECDAVGVVPVVEVPEPPQPPAAVVVADLSPVIVETVGRFATITDAPVSAALPLPPAPEPPAAVEGGKEESPEITPAGDGPALSGEAEPPKPAGAPDVATEPTTPPAGATDVPAAQTTPPAVTTPQPQTQPNRPHGHGHDRKRR